MFLTPSSQKNFYVSWNMQTSIFDKKMFCIVFLYANFSFFFFEIAFGLVITKPNAISKKNEKSGHPTVIMSNAIGSSRESNPSCRICNVGVVLLGHVGRFAWINI